MNFDLNEEQQLFAASLKRFLGKDYAFEARRRIIASDAGFGAEVWRSLAELGALGLPLPSDFGGIGGGAVELISTMEAFGGALVVEPFVSTVGLGARLLLLAGSSEQKARLLPRIADGSLRLAFAHREANARYDVSQVAASATRDGGGYRLTGRKRTVLDAPVADRLIVSARVVDRDGLILLALVEPTARGVAMRPQRTLDGRRAADIEFDDVRVPIGDAMPLLERAKAVDLVTVAEERKGEEFAGGTMSDHLTRHGIKANMKRLTKGDLAIEDVILSYAADSGADFMVMGGYGHSRLREFILGGVTRGILAEMTVPVLMSH